MKSDPFRHRALALPLAAAAAAILFASCSSSTKTSAASAASATTTVRSSADNSSVTVKASRVPGVGTVLVNGDGRTLYVLASEKSDKITCIATGGCTKYWPPAVLPSGMSHGLAGTGVKASALGTATSPSGDIRLTYAGWPLYTYAGDSGPGKDSGQGVKDAWGTWWVLSPSGNPIRTAAAPTTAPTTPTAPTAPTTPTTLTSPTSATPPSPTSTSAPTSSTTTTAPASGGAGF